MSTVRKRKVKIKKKNFTIFIICLFVIGITLTKGITLVAKSIHSFNRSEIVKKNSKSKKKSKNESKDKRLVELNNIDQKIDYFNKDYIDRYIAYKRKNKSLKDEQIIKNVNMNLDYKFYENEKKTKSLNTKTILVNKYNYLTDDYVPDNLETISTNYALSNMKLVSYAKDAFEELAKAAKKENLNIIAMSTYRSYEYQVDLYNRYVKTDGKEAADTYSGRPGHSEHQTGLAADVFNNKEPYTNFEKTKEFDWMQEHAHEYGFILRFPKGKEKETGYQYESWHYRYVGKDIAKYIKEKNISLEEYHATKIKDW